MYPLRTDFADDATLRRFKQEGRDLIIVDTSGRHKQSGALFEEMRQVLAQPPHRLTLSASSSVSPVTSCPTLLLTVTEKKQHPDGFLVTSHMPRRFEGPNPNPDPNPDPNLEPNPNFSYNPHPNPNPVGDPCRWPARSSRIWSSS